MEKTTISQLKARLSAYLKKVRAGQTVLIFDRDEPIARLEGVHAGGHTAPRDDRLMRLERAGLLRPATPSLSLEPLRAGAPRAAATGVVALLGEPGSGPCSSWRAPPPPRA